MKNALSILMIAVVLAVAGCGQKQANPSQNNAIPQTAEAATDAASPAEHYDLFYVEEGAIWLYDLDTHCADRYNNETDSVVRAVLSKDNVLYYSVAKDGDLLLRSLDLKAANPMPETLANWNVPVEGRTELDGFGGMYLDYGETKVALERDLRWFTGLYYNLAVYDLAAKTMTVHQLYREVFAGDEFMYFEDLPDNTGFDRWGPATVSSNSTGNLLENVDNEIYYVGDGQRVCLTDQVDLEGLFGIGLEKEEYDVDASLDPTGKKALIGYNAVLGDGVVGAYVVSDIDGRQQTELTGTDYETSNPTWLPDGTLLYIGYDDGPALCLLEPDGRLRKIAQSEIFAVLH